MPITDEGSCQLDVVVRITLELADCCSTLFDHVEKHLRQLRVLIQVHQVRKTIVHFECHTYFLKTGNIFDREFLSQLISCLLLWFSELK